MARFSCHNLCLSVPTNISTNLYIFHITILPILVYGAEVISINAIIHFEIIEIKYCEVLAKLLYYCFL